MGKFAIIDTETNWNNKVMPVGTVIADEDTFQLIDTKYFVLKIILLLNHRSTDYPHYNSGPTVCNHTVGPFPFVVSIILLHRL